MSIFTLWFLLSLANLSVVPVSSRRDVTDEHVDLDTDDEHDHLEKEIAKVTIHNKTPAVNSSLIQAANQSPQLADIFKGLFKIPQEFDLSSGTAAQVGRYTGFLMRAKLKVQYESGQWTVSLLNNGVRGEQVMVKWTSDQQPNLGNLGKPNKALKDQLRNAQRVLGAKLTDNDLEKAQNAHTLSLSLVADFKDAANEKMEKTFTQYLLAGLVLQNKDNTLKWLPQVVCKGSKESVTITLDAKKIELVAVADEPKDAGPTEDDEANLFKQQKYFTATEKVTYIRGARGLFQDKSQTFDIGGGESLLQDTCPGLPDRRRLNLQIKYMTASAKWYVYLRKDSTYLAVWSSPEVFTWKTVKDEKKGWVEEDKPIKRMPLAHFPPWVHVYYLTLTGLTLTGGRFKDTTFQQKYLECAGVDVILRLKFSLIGVAPFLKDAMYPTLQEGEMQDAPMYPAIVAKGGDGAGGHKEFRLEFGKRSHESVYVSPLDA